MKADDDLQCQTVAQFLAARAAKVTDDIDQVTLMAFESPEALVLVLRCRSRMRDERKAFRVLVAGEDPLEDFYAQQKAAARSPDGRA